MDYEPLLWVVCERGRHVGDIGNIQPDANYEVHVEIEDNLISLEGINSVVGRSVVVSSLNKPSCDSATVGIVFSGCPS